MIENIINITHQFEGKLWSTPSFYKQSIFDPRPENCLSFSKKSAQKNV